MPSFDIIVRGVTFEGRQVHLERLNETVEHGWPFSIRLEAEPTNQYDPFAVKVIVRFDNQLHHVGYVPKEISKDVAELLAEELIQGFKIKELRKNKADKWYLIVTFEVGIDEAKQIQRSDSQFRRLVKQEGGTMRPGVIPSSNSETKLPRRTPSFRFISTEDLCQ